LDKKRISANTSAKAQGGYSTWHSKKHPESCRIGEIEMKYYYAIFRHSKDAIEVEFPDLAGCVTFGNDWDEALANATDVLAAWLANAEPKFINEPSSFKKLSIKHKNEKLMPIALDEKILESYEELKRINIIFPSRLLREVDEFRKKTGLKRSTLLKIATEEYLEKERSASVH
jgi:predicted RNase H-like HicB family nuclease